MTLGFFTYCVSVALIAFPTLNVLAQPSRSAPPNVVLIYADDLGYGDLSCYGATKISTPNVDKLAAEGLRFTNAHCTAATCTPSRYSILTGEYAWRKKGTGVLPGNAGLIIPTDKATLGKIFQTAGYKTACIGKWHLGLGPKAGPDWNGEIKPGPNEVGFDYSFIFPATADRVPTVYIKNHKVVALDPNDPIAVNYKTKIGAEFTGKENPELLKMHSSPNQGHDGTIVNGIGRMGWMTGGQKARWQDEGIAGTFTDEAELFIEQNRAQPFFLYLALSDIHVPRMPDTRFKGKSGLGYRGDSILQMDYTVGRIMTKLADLDLTDNTIFIFTSDNGPVLDDGYQDGAVTELNGHTPLGPLRGGKYGILEGGTRIPFILRWPVKVMPGISNALISQVDLPASFVALTGQDLQEGDSPDGVDASGALLGRSTVGRESVVVEGRAMALLRDQWKYIEPHNGPELLKHVNIESGFSADPQLYDLSQDLAEKNNRASEQPDLLKKLAAELEDIKAGHP